MDLAADELIRAIRLPRGTTHRLHAYRKVGTRRAQAISKVCFAGALEIADGTVRDVRLAFASVAPTVIRASHAEAALRGRPLGTEAATRAAEALTSDIAPIDDLRSTARYRMRVAQNVLREFLDRGRP
jgi:xanthine dehydrogenase iron-sulfur cluster and FAD-binding subunit A